MVFNLNVVHISATPLAGAPIRIVNALNKYTNIKARSINLSAGAYGVLTFPEDLIWGVHRNECEAVIRDADILHFHHWFDFASKNNPFKFDFLSAIKPNAKYLMHWHSNPMTIAKLNGVSVSSLVDTDVPQMVVTQFHESYYPNAYPVPSIIEVKDLQPKTSQREKPIVFFSPSNGRNAYEERWETKGKPEVISLLKKLKSKDILDYDLVQKMPFSECMQRRIMGDIVIDDIVTGSFHQTTLEGLAAGKPTLAYLDARTQMVLSQLTGSTDIPIINVRYFEAERVLAALAKDRVLREEIGQFSRDWMLKYYSEDKMIALYCKGYSNLLAGEWRFNERYSVNKYSKLWLYTTVPDLIWETRRQNEMKFWNKLSYFINYKNLKKKIAQRFPFIRAAARKIDGLLRKENI